MASDESDFVLNVLLIEDESAVLRAIWGMFASRGLAVIACRNGDDAVELLARRPVDVVVSDVVMEGLVGTALLNAIRALPGHAHTPVIFMSSMPEARVRDLVEGDYEFVRKPFDFDVLMRTIARVTDDAVGPLPPARAPSHAKHLSTLG